MATVLETCNCGAEHEVEKGRGLDRCACGQTKCRECSHTCTVCGYEGCEECMTYDEEAGEWLCGEQDCREELKRQLRVRAAKHRKWVREVMEAHR